MEEILDFFIFTMLSDEGTSSNSCKIKLFRTRPGLQRASIPQAHSSFHSPSSQCATEGCLKPWGISLPTGSVHCDHGASQITFLPGKAVLQHLGMLQKPGQVLW